MPTATASLSSVSAARSCNDIVTRHTDGPGQYIPPQNCPFNRVVLNLTVVSEGRQFDRLAILYLNDTELWRTSTAEPKPHPGISWTVWKDTSPLITLWRQPQTLIFDLGNIVNDVYTGLFNATLTATFFDVDLVSPHAEPADLIVPVSARRGKDGAPSAFIYPEVKALDRITLPRNIRRAVFTVAATGQGDEEFWWSNVPESNSKSFNTTLPGLSSFREVQVFVDGAIAGVMWPFPTVFTGGISPPLHRPVVGIGAFDLPEQEIDISPFLGSLCDGKEHLIHMEVVGYDDTRIDAIMPMPATVPMSWVLTGKIFIWLDEDESSVTTGLGPITGGGTNYLYDESPIANKSLNYCQGIERRQFAYSTIHTQEGERDVHWTQEHKMDNEGHLWDSGKSWNVTASYKSESKALDNDETYFITSSRYPLYASYEYSESDPDFDFTASVKFNQTLVHDAPSNAVFPSGIEPFLHQLPEGIIGTRLDTTRKGFSFVHKDKGEERVVGEGSTTQSYALNASYPNLCIQLYSRELAISIETTLRDEWELLQGGVNTPPVNLPKEDKLNGQDQGFAPSLVKQSGPLKYFRSKDVTGQPE